MIYFIKTQVPQRAQDQEGPTKTCSACGAQSHTGDSACSKCGEAERPRERPPGDRVMSLRRYTRFAAEGGRPARRSREAMVGMGDGTTTRRAAPLRPGFGRMPTARAALTTNWFVTTSIEATTSGVDTRSWSCMCNDAKPGINPSKYV